MVYNTEAECEKIEVPCAGMEIRLKNRIFQSRDLCLRALDTNSLCAKDVRRNEDNNEDDMLCKTAEIFKPDGYDAFGSLYTGAGTVAADPY